MYKTKVYPTYVFIFVLNVRIEIHTFDTQWDIIKKKNVAHNYLNFLV
jgi:hypothetical protein